MEDHQPHNLYKVLGIAKCIKADSPSTPDSQSKVSGLLLIMPNDDRDSTQDSESLYIRLRVLVHKTVSPST